MLAETSEVDGEVKSSNDSPAEPMNAEYTTDMREFGALGTRQGTTQLASMSSTMIQNDSDVKHKSSLGRLSMFRSADRGTIGTMSTMATVKGKTSSRSIYEASTVTDLSRHSDEHVHDIDEEGLENVRACCGGSIINFDANYSRQA
jgi:hypothetical protein